MPDLFEINDSFEPFFPDSNSESRASVSQNTDEDLSFLEFFFESLIEINQTQPSGISNILLIRFHNQLKNNQFNNATQTIRDYPHCLELINNLLPATKLLPFLLFLLRKRLVQITKLIWESNPQLASYFSGKVIQIQYLNTQGILETQILQLTFLELIAHFKSALASHSSMIIRSMWVNNPQLASYFSGKAIQVQVLNAQGTLETQTWQITIPVLIAHFKAALAGRASPIIRSMWKSHPQLAPYFSGKAIRLQVPNAQGIIETYQLTFLQVIAHFKAALAGRTLLIIKSMWENNSQLASYFSGKAIQLPVLNTHGALEIQTWQLTLPELVPHFKSALSSQCPVIIKEMWENNPQLASYFSGRAVCVQVINAAGILESKTLQITIPELIAHFKSALAGRTLDIIKSMWEGNVLLQDAIKKLDNEKLIELTEKVLASSINKKSEFITTFLNFISNKPILEACLDKRNTKKQSHHIKNQVDALNIRLKSLASASALNQDPLQENSLNNLDHLESKPLLNLLDNAFTDDYVNTTPTDSLSLVDYSVFQSISQTKKRLREELNNVLPQSKLQKI